MGRLSEEELIDATVNQTPFLLSHPSLDSIIDYMKSSLILNPKSPVLVPSTDNFSPSLFDNILKFSLSGKVLRDANILSCSIFLKKLKELDLSDNSLSDLLFLTDSFRELMVVNFSKNKIKSIGVCEGNKMTGLYSLSKTVQVVNLSGNCISGTIQSLSLYLFSNLKRLNLSHNELTFSSPVSFSSKTSKSTLPTNTG
jgi:hypothetical protein